MQTIQQILTEALQTAFQAAGFETVATAVPSDRPELGDFQCNAALALAKATKQQPHHIAEKVISHLSHPAITKAEIAGPGFINLVLNDEFLTQQLQALAADSHFGAAQTSSPRNILIDYSGPNVAKPLHVGHLRSSIVGDSIRRLLAFQGHTLTGDTHLGDWGTPMGLVIEGIRREQPDLPYFNPDHTGPYPAESPVTVEDLERIYPAMSGLAKQEPAIQAQARQTTKELQNGNPGYTTLWQHFVTISVADAKADLDLLGVRLERWYGESHYHPRIAPLIAKLRESGQAIESEGALVVPIKDQPDLPPLLLEKSDGSYLYSTTDLATVEERVSDDHFQTIIIETDQRQKLHFQQVFAVARQTGIAPAEVELIHIGHGTINGPDGKPFKSRDGGAMRLHDLIQLALDKARERMDQAGIAKDYPAKEREDIITKVAIAALKYADLKNAPKSDYNLDTDQFTSFEGRTGPYLLYTGVRIKSILRKAEAKPELANLTQPNEAARPLYLLLTAFPSVIEQTTAAYAPHLLADHLFQLAQACNRFYQQCNILREEDETVRNSWLALLQATLSQLETGLNLLGIEVPERM